MSAQDNVEKVLRSLHVMLSKSEPVSGQPGRVIIDKQAMLDLFTELNKGIYGIMDEYELTTQSRDHAEREFQKHGEEIIRNANHKAEDIYAASVMYTDEALNHVQEIMRMSSNAIETIYSELVRKMKEEEHTVKTNQLELKSQLQDLVDTDKYLKLIEDRNKEIEKERERREGKTPEKTSSIYANRKTEVRVNKEYLEKLGLAEETKETEEAGEEPGGDEPKQKEIKNQINNQAKNAQEEEKSFFRKAFGNVHRKE